VENGHGWKDGYMQKQRFALHFWLSLLSVRMRILVLNFGFFCGSRFGFGVGFIGLRVLVSVLLLGTTTIPSLSFVATACRFVLPSHAFLLSIKTVSRGNNSVIIKVKA